MVDLLRAYQDPERYAIDLSIDNIVADKKIHDEGVKRYVQLLKEGVYIKPIIVIKHPKVDEYAVLNGHHRFWAYRDAGRNSVRAVIVEDYVGIGFLLTKNGHLQPTPEVTKYLRVPFKQFQAYMQEFLKDPKGMLREQMGKGKLLKIGL